MIIIVIIKTIIDNVISVSLVTFVPMAKTRATKTKGKAKHPLLKRITNVATKVFIYFLLVSVFWVIALRFINPPITLLMVLRNIERKADGKPFKTEKNG